MGTSTSHPSPDTPNWRVARALLGRQDVAPERQAEELWRAAIADRGERLAAALGSPDLARAVTLAQTGTTPTEAVRAFDAVLQQSKAADLTLDMGRRALARAAAQHTGSAGFAAELFAEATSYYVSRDLSGLVGGGARVATPAAAVRLKDEIRNVVRSVVQTQSHGQVPDNPGAWRAYVGTVVAALQGGGGREGRSSPERPRRRGR